MPRELPVMYRFFLNRPDADAYTEPDPAAGYVGNLVMAPLVGDGQQPVATLRCILVEGVLKEIAANDQNSITIVPVGVDIPPLGLKGPKGPAVEANFVRLFSQRRRNSAAVRGLSAGGASAAFSERSCPDAVAGPARRTGSRGPRSYSPMKCASYSWEARPFIRPGQMNTSIFVQLGNGDNFVFDLGEGRPTIAPSASL